MVVSLYFVQSVNARPSAQTASTSKSMIVMPMAQLRSCGPLGWAVFGPARAGKSALAQSCLGLARADRISPKKYARSGLLKMSKNT